MRRGTVVAGLVLAATIATASPALAVTDPPSNTPSVVANVAIANVGKGDCSRNTGGGIGYYKSCTNHEYWCADFAKWVWVQAAVPGANTTSLTAAAYSFYSWSKGHARFTTAPRLGAVAIFSKTRGDHTSDSGGIHHVAVVTAVSGSSVKLVSGDWGGHGSTMREFADSSHVVKNNSGSWINGTAGGYATSMGMYFVGYAVI